VANRRFISQDNNTPPTKKKRPQKKKKNKKNGKKKKKKKRKGKKPKQERRQPKVAGKFSPTPRVVVQLASHEIHPELEWTESGQTSKGGVAPFNIATTRARLWYP